jgi:hypothetical protein
MDKTQIRNNRIDHIYRLMEANVKNMDKIMSMLKNLDKDDQRQTYLDVSGLVGTFDGMHMVTQDGIKHDVPTNYAAKSRLVVGDTLKMIDDNGSIVFKQIEKVERKKVEGILTRKEGKWHIISDSGTYRVSDIAADFQHAELNDEASAFVPMNNLNVTYAALDSVKKKHAPKPFTTSPSTDRPVRTERPIAKPFVAKPETGAAPAASRPRPAVSQAPRPTMGTKPASTPVRKPMGNRSAKPGPSRGPKPGGKREYVEDIRADQTPSVPTAPVNLDDDDLR